MLYKNVLLFDVTLAIGSFILKQIYHNFPNKVIKILCCRYQSFRPIPLKLKTIITIPILSKCRDASRCNTDEHIQYTYKKMWYDC